MNNIYYYDYQIICFSLLFLIELILLRAVQRKHNERFLRTLHAKSFRCSSTLGTMKSSSASLMHSEIFLHNLHNKNFRNTSALHTMKASSACQIEFREIAIMIALNVLILSRMKYLSPLLHFVQWNLPPHLRTLRIESVCNTSKLYIMKASSASQMIFLFYL